MATPKAWDAFTFSVIYVTSGQGAGQIRFLNNSFVKIGDYTYFTVDTPFAVDPNKNSRVTCYGQRTNVFVTNSDFSNGRHVGTYGTLVDAVFDGNTWRNSGSGVEISSNGGQIWYFTSKDNDARDIITGHTTSVLAYPTGLTASTVSSSLTFFGIQFRNNYTGAGGCYKMGNAAYINATMDIIIENCTSVSSVNSMIESISSGTGIDGLWLRNNNQYTEENNQNSEITPYSDSVISCVRASAKNKYGYLRIMCDEYSATTDIVQVYGDVNNDGYISLKDITLIRYYLAEKITLSSAQLKYADYLRDGSIDSRDIFAIRCHIIGIDYKGETGPGSSSSSSSSSSSGASSSSSSGTASSSTWSDSSEEFFDFRY